ncbi:MAG TPA: patatin-like phospholipase family protein [Nitrososphaeraceae archaeon]|nr:patatin-like phospholipase family protein [Nitrososphaeraceae archaeon]
MSHNKAPKTQRALVLQGGGALGAYEAGVLEVLCTKLYEEDRENKREDSLLFDIVAGTSIGATNAAILVSQFLQTQSWVKAADKLHKFWTYQLSIKNPDISELSKPWYDEWMKRTPTAASQEAARRYYSVKKLLLNQVRNNMYYQCDPVIFDKRFFDNNVWVLHSIKPLQDSIQQYAKFPIATEFHDKEHGQRQPRLLVFSVDVAEGVTVAFDSYPKAEGSRKSEYGNCVISYNDGITIDHLMASNTLPEFYYYARVPTIEQEGEDIRCMRDKSKEKNMRYFWDGGLLSNTPIRELLDAHQQYWNEVENQGKIPDLEVYIVNVHPSKIDIHILPEDYDGVKDRKNDIIFGDRTSHYDEKMAHLIADYANFGTQVKGLAYEAISQVDDEKKKQELEERLKTILATKTSNKDSKAHPRRYEDLTRFAFNLTIAMRIERTNYIKSIFGKTGDLTLETINKLIKEGKCDAWFSIIQKEIIDSEIADRDKHDLIELLYKAMQNLRKNDYEDNYSQTYHSLTDFVKALEDPEKSKTDRSAKIVKSVEAFMAILA